MRMLAEQLVGEARARRPRRMKSTERIVLGASAGAFVAAAIAIAGLIDSGRSFDPILTVCLLAAYALVSRVRFEFGTGYVVPEQLVFIPLLALTPIEFVPFLAAGAVFISMLPDFARGSWSRDRWLSPFSDSWFSIGPVLVLAALAPGEPSLSEAYVYALAFVAQISGDLIWSVIRDKTIDDIAPEQTVKTWASIVRVDAVLSPIAFIVAVAAASELPALLTLVPLVWLLQIFSQERQERYGATLELHRAYRGTVMLLADVVEFEDTYTADHARSVVEFVHAVADELRVDPASRYELEFAALLHDVGKISIPKQILNKPAALDAEEFELMKTHTIEGQFMLDRVGGLLGRVGEIVRSCHEHWDGSGYPDGLQGEEIPLESRIVLVCDTYSAITSDRPYRAARSHEEALSELTAYAGRQFDPRVVNAFFKVVEQNEPVVAPVDEVRAVLAGAAMASRPGTA